MKSFDQDIFFKDIEEETHNFNLCVALYFNPSSKIEKIQSYKEGLPEKWFTLSDFYNILKDIKGLSKIDDFAKSNFISHTQKLFKELEDKHETLRLPHPIVKLVLIVDAKSLMLKHWTSMPVVGDASKQVIEYFDGMSRFSKMALDEDKQAELDYLIKMIMAKMIATP